MALDYEFYKTVYMGRVIPDESTFNSIVIGAEAYVNSLIISRENLIYDEVKNKVNMAVCAVADIDYAVINVDENQKLLSGESVGNHSVSYSVSRKTNEQRDAERRNKVLTFLRGTGLLYGGLK